MQFLARWGNACGTDFKRDDFCNRHAQWNYQRAYLEDRLRKPWVVCSEVNITKHNNDMSTAIKEYDFTSGSAVGSASDKNSAGINMNISIPTSPVTPSPLSMLQKLPTPTLLPASSPKITPALPTTSTLTMPSLVKTPAPPVKQSESVNNNNNNNMYSDDELQLLGGSHEQVGAFDNKKELKEFIKMFKKQNRKSYKSKNSNTRRNKKK
jgi:hypothetical protein